MIGKECLNDNILPITLCLPILQGVRGTRSITYISKKLSLAGKSFSFECVFNSIKSKIHSARLKCRKEGYYAECAIFLLLPKSR